MDKSGEKVDKSYRPFYFFAKHRFSIQPRTGPDKFPVQLGLASSDLGLFLPLVYHDREVWSAEVNTHSSDMIKRMKMTYLAIEI